MSLLNVFAKKLFGDLVALWAGWVMAQQTECADRTFHHLEYKEKTEQRSVGKQYWDCLHVCFVYRSCVLTVCIS